MEYLINTMGESLTFRASLLVSEGSLKCLDGRRKYYHLYALMLLEVCEDSVRRVWLLLSA